MGTSVYQAIVCRACGQNVPVGNFCGNCGQRLTERAILKNEVECPNCGEAVAEGAFCSCCGKALPAPVHEQDNISQLAALIESGYFPFTEQEKAFVLYLLSKSKNNGEDIICEAPLEHVFALFDIFDNSMEQLRNKVDGLIV